MGIPLIGIVGAYGATGSVVARTLDVQSDLSLRLIGRNDAKLRELAATLRRPAEVVPADVMDDGSLEAACRGCGTVVNCAAPSSVILDRVARAALSLGVHYVDAGGDARVHDALTARNDEIVKRGLVFLLGWWATVAETKGKEDHDPGEIVIDEVAGQWIALWPLSLGLWMISADPAVFPYPGWFGGFVLFRLFDILKPWPVSWADRQPTALGVMLDDVLAGILAALCVTALAAIAHGWLV